MTVTISKNLKRVKTFINKNGEEINDPMGHDVGTTPGANRLPGGAEAFKKEKN